MQQPLPSLIDYLIRIPKESTLRAAFRQPGESSGDRESGMIQHLYLLTNMHRGHRPGPGRGPREARPNMHSPAPAAGRAL